MLKMNLHRSDRIFVPVDNLMRFSMSVTSYHRSRSNQVEKVHDPRWGDRLIQRQSRGGLIDRNFELNMDPQILFAPVDNLMRFSMSVTSYHRNRSNQVEKVHDPRWGDRLFQRQIRGGLIDRNFQLNMNLHILFVPVDNLMRFRCQSRAGV